MSEAPPPSLGEGRLCIVLALLWSLGGAFAKALKQDTFLGLHEPALADAGLQIAFYRALFAGIVLLPMLRRIDLSFDPRMLGMMASFATMNALYVSAMTLGTAANAIFLQYTAPMWMYLACVWLLGEPAERRNTIALAIGLVGIGVILFGGWQEPQQEVEGGPNAIVVLAVALGSGVAYAGVLVFLRVLRERSSRWLTVLNHLGAAAVLAPFVLRWPWPSGPQLALLFVFGAVQMALPYWLVARGLRSVSPQEAGTITLMEPILNPIWVYFLAGEVPSPYTFAGGAFILGALAWRCWPRGTHGG